MSLYHPREDWQDPSKPVSGPKPQGNRGTWVIHYPGNPGSYEPMTDSEVISALRMAHSSYLNSRGYSYGYNFCVAQSGSAWEVRGNDMNNAANAGKKVTGNFNHVSQSIQVMVGKTNTASPAAVAKVNAIIATHPDWAVVIHGDVDYTSCCGDGLIHQVRSGVIGQQGSVAPVPPPVVAPVPIVMPEDYNPPDQWWLFPLDQNKSTYRNGDTDVQVRYLQDVIYFYAGGGIDRDGQFGSQTEQRVKDLQALFAIVVDGVVGPQTWKIIDYLVTLNQPPVVVEPPVKPPVGVEVLPSVAWYINKGDTPWSVAKVAYGSGNQNGKLNANDFSSYSTPRLPVFATTPGVSGKRARVESGEGALKVLRRMGFSDTSANLNIFWQWNGGAERVFQIGDIVHMPFA